MEEIIEKTIDIKVKLNVTINGKPIEEVKKEPITIKRITDSKEMSVEDLAIKNIKYTYRDI